jgi:hypothetical protein
VTKRANGTFSWSVEENSERSVEITVGFKMVVGIRYEKFVYLVGEPRPAQPRNFGYSTHSADWIFAANQDDISVREKRYIVEIDLVVSETDIPPKHMWMPQSGKYQVLFTRALKQIVE